MNFRIDFGSFRVRTTADEARRLVTAGFVEETYPLPGHQSTGLSVFAVPGEAMTLDVEGTHFRVGVPRSRLFTLLGVLEDSSAGRRPAKGELEIAGSVSLTAEQALEVRLEVDLKSLGRPDPARMNT